MGFQSDLRERLVHLLDLLTEGVLGKLLGIVWLLVGLVSFAKTEALSPEQQQKWQFINMIPPFAWWVAMSFFIMALWIFEASFRYCKKVKAKAAVERRTTETLMHELAAIRTQQLPKLAMTFDPTAKDCVDRVPISIYPEQVMPGVTGFPEQVQCMFYRLRVDAVSAKPVIGCRGCLVEVRKQSADGSWDRQGIRDALNLQWGTLGFDAAEIRPHKQEHLDLFWIDEKERAIHPIAHHPSNAAEIFASPGTFQLDIHISNEDGVTEKRTMQVRQTTRWDEAVVELVNTP